MGRNIFIMQRNEADTEWETKTLQGEGKMLGTDIEGGLTFDPVNFAAADSITPNGGHEKWTYYVDCANFYAAPSSSVAITASLWMSGSNGPRSSVVRIMNTGSTSDVAIQIGNGSTVATLTPEQHIGIHLIRWGEPENTPHYILSNIATGYIVP